MIDKDWSIIYSGMSIYFNVEILNFDNFSGFCQELIGDCFLINLKPFSVVLVDSYLAKIRVHIFKYINILKQ